MHSSMLPSSIFLNYFFYLKGMTCFEMDGFLSDFFQKGIIFGIMFYRDHQSSFIVQGKKKERFNTNTGISAPTSPYSVFLADPVVYLNLTSLPMAPRLSWIW